ncbi:MAG: energy-coupling factor transporter transmembrane component T [Erysipelotrichaceae bacterium]|nr:energy-coupling factor transporter transmembrane component T [Erysipelotrichaceae bacterium]
MKVKLFSYNQLDTFVHRLSGVTKLICFLLLTSAVMFTYDLRVIVCVFLFSLVMVKVAQISLKQVKPMLIYVSIFLLLNFILTFIFAPGHGPELYGSRHELFSFFGNYIVTKEQLLYQFTKIMKYLSAIPLGFIFFLTTNPSEFASSLNNIKVPYKACTSLSLTLRYFPDIQKDFNDVSFAQQARGLDNSEKAPMKDRIINTTKIIIPLIFSTLDRVELITNAMDLRGYAKKPKRTWYSFRALNKEDYLSIAVSAVIFAISLFMRFVVVKSMYYNPFI